MDDGTNTVRDKIQTVVEELNVEGFKICRLQFNEASIKGGPGKLDLADQAIYWNGHPLWQEHKTASEFLIDQIRELGY